MNKQVFDMIVSMVQAERLKQDKKWGIQDHPPEKWVAILVEEVGEAAQAGLKWDVKRYGTVGERNEAAINMLYEWVQVAAVAFAALDNIFGYESTTEQAANRLMDTAADVLLDQILEADDDATPPPA